MEEYEYTVPASGRPWMRLLIILSLFILLGVLVWAVFFRSPNNMNPPQAKVTSSQSPSSKAQSVASPTPISKSTPSSVSDSPVSTSTKPSQLANTGPGDVASLFIIGTIVGAVTYRVYLYHRYTKA